MKIRIITGVCYVAVMVGLFLARQFGDYRIFHLLTYLVSIVGTLELNKMLKPFCQKWVGKIALLSSILALPAFLLLEYLGGENLGAIGFLSVIAIFVIAVSVYSLVKKEDLKQFGIKILHLVYPTVCMLFMCLANENKNGFIILLTSFVVSPISDTMAYFTGMAFGKHKLCPKISPKKTWEGAIGGTIGGGLGAMLVYWIFTPQINFGVPLLFFLLVGLVASIVNIFGDLTESLIKRRAGVKDSGKILPGHGGILDRFDGTMFAVIAIYLLFLLV